MVSLAPHLTEIVFALGQGERLVGVTSFCAYPPQARALPKCGGYMDPDLEKILALRPDLVLVHGEHDKVTQLCRQNKLSMLRTSVNDLAGLLFAIQQIGEALGCHDRARALVEEIRSTLEAIGALVSDRPRQDVFLSMSRPLEAIKTLYTTNGKGFISEMLAVAGGRNVFAETDVLYPKITASELLLRRPDVIVEIQPERNLSAAQRERMIAQWAELGPLPAIQNNRVYFLTKGFAMIPGPRVTLLAERFAEMLHPTLKDELRATTQASSAATQPFQGH